MAKKKAEEPTKKFGRPPLEEGAKTAKFTLRITPEWLSWLGRVATAKKKDKAVVVRDMAKVWAKHEKLEPPPEE